MKKILLTSVLSTVITGCGWNGYKQHEQETYDVKDEINSHMSFIYETNAAQYIDEPPKFIKDTVLDTRPSWLTKPQVSIHMDELASLESIMNSLSGLVGLFPIYQPGVNVSKRIVKISVNNASVADTLDYLSAQTDYSYEIVGKQIVWSKFETKTIPIATLIGDIEFGMGTESSSGDETEDSTTTTSSSSSLSSSNVDYTMVTAEEMEVLSGILQGVNTILAGTGSASINPASTNITVTTTPSRMKRVEKFIESENKEITKQAVLMIRILNFQSNQTNSAGINWNLVKTSTDGALELAHSFSNSVDTNSFMRFSPTFGGLDGTSILISALEKQGTVSVANTFPITVMNNRPTRFASKDMTGFISNVKVIEDPEFDKSTTELEKGLVEEGYSVYTLAKIIDDKVLLQLSSQLSSLKDFDETEINDVTVKTPQFSESAFNQPNIINNGETLVLNAFSQSVSSSGKSSQFNNDLIGGNQGASKTFETIVLITPTIL